MVLYSNVNLNQRVELLYNNNLLRGTVKFKGAVNNLDGEWIGVALDQPCKSYGSHRIDIVKLLLLLKVVSFYIL